MSNGNRIQTIRKMNIKEQSLGAPSGRDGGVHGKFVILIKYVAAGKGTPFLSKIRHHRHRYDGGAGCSYFVGLLSAFIRNSQPVVSSTVFRGFLAEPLRKL